ncbi:ROK family protein [Halorhabdus rudnickae]|uniref:ROK family protein n=1 Tax=Halorhabdus rudnickae TaxID=1775544 RepID=UPI001082C4A9|nr:ROK family protein [Halorhabdus rudnickae]
MGVYAGIDIGATYTRAIVGDETGEELGRNRQETPQGPTGTDVTEGILDTLRGAADNAGVDPTELTAVGIGSVGPLNLAEGALGSPANLPDTIDKIPLTGPIGNLTETDDVYLHNDGIAGVIGERFHSDRNPDDMAYVTISTGIGAGVCVDGHVLSGCDGNAAEVGHMTLDPEGTMTCGCGQDGHWEAYTSGQNIPRYAKEFYQAGDRETDMPVTSPDFTAPDLFEYAGEDEFADAFIDRLATFNAMGVANVVQAYAPLVIYLGGAVAENNPELVVEKIRERLPDMVFGNIPEIKLTTLGDDVVLKGALASALTQGTGDREKLRE